MDDHTLDLLEFDRIRALVANLAACSLGRDRALALKPAMDLATVLVRLEYTTEMTECVASGNPPPLGGLHDINAEFDGVENGRLLSAEEFSRVNETLGCFTRARRWFDHLPDKSRGERLVELGRKVGRFTELAEAIDAILDREGRVVDHASPRLKTIRAEMETLKAEAAERVRVYIANPTVRSYLQFPQATWSGDRYVLPVKADQRGRVPGIVHRSSATGETVFVEPSACVELGNALQALIGQEQQEVTRILRELTRRIAGELRALRRTLNVMAEVDLITAQARFGLDFRAVRPDLTTDGSLRLVSARHPLLVHLAAKAAGAAHLAGPGSQADRRQAVVPIDIHLGEGFDVLVITGPNTGGKTVTLKTVALLAIMAQSGLFVTAGHGARLPVFTGVYADIGDEQSIEQSLSTYSSHVRRIAEILNRAGPSTLVILDELGGGTDPAEGAALGRAILDELLRLKCRAIVTTHLGALKTYAYTHDRAENASVEFDPQTLRPTYRLLIGEPGNSNALSIAERLGLNAGVLFRARRYLAEGDTAMTAAIDEIRKQRRATEEAKTAAEAAKAAADAVKADYERQLSQIAGQEARDAQRNAWRAALNPGDRVYVPRFSSTGQFLRYVGGAKAEASVQVGYMQVRLPMAQVYPPDEAKV